MTALTAERDNVAVARWLLNRAETEGYSPADIAACRRALRGAERDLYAARTSQPITILAGAR